MAKVLLVETEEPLMRLMAWFLLEELHRVTAAPNLDVARTAAADGRPEVIIFNTHLPSDVKRGVIAELRTRSPGAAVIDINDESNTPGDTGADVYLRRPFDSYDLLTAVKELAPPRSE